jgi:hypothetical protein
MPRERLTAKSKNGFGPASQISTGILTDDSAFAIIGQFLLS